MKLILTMAVILSTCVSPIKQDNTTNALMANVQQIANLIEIYPTVGMPDYLEKVTVINRSTSKIRCWIANPSESQITGVQMRLYIVDATGKIKNIENKESVVDLAPHSATETSFYLDNKLGLDDRLLIVVWETISVAGVWSINPRQTDEVIKARISSGRTGVLDVHYTANTILSDGDKSEIFSETLRQVLRDSKLKNLISFTKSKFTIISRENIDFDFNRNLSGFDILVLDPSEIQQKADNEGEIMYFKFRPIDIEGSTLRVTLEYLEEFGRNLHGKAFIPCCGGLIFEYHKDNDRWISKYISNFRIL